MFPTNSPIPINSNALVVHDPASQTRGDNNYSRNDVPSETPPYPNIYMSDSKRLQDELEKTGAKMRQHQDNIKNLKGQKNKLDDAILDLQVSLGKSLSSGVPKFEDGDSSHGRNEQDIVVKIKTEKCAAGIFCQLKSQGLQVSNPALSQEVLGVVATLGKVDDENLSRLFSEYLGLETMLALVCKTNDGIKSLEAYDIEGFVKKNSGIHALGTSVGQDLKGRFVAICLENLRPYAGEFVSGDTQRRLDIPKPRLPSGDIPSGFLGFAVNMFHVDKTHLYCLTSNGAGLRETLLYNLFSRLQVYRTRAEMLLALPCISDGAVSVDGGMIKASGVFSLGCREDVNIMFPARSDGSNFPDNYNELEQQLKKKKWEKEKLNDDIRREQSLLDQEKYNFQLRKQDFLNFLKDSSSAISQHQYQAAGRDRQAPR